jgi:hypothetical protein
MRLSRLSLAAAGLALALARPAAAGDALAPPVLVPKAPCGPPPLLVPQPPDQQRPPDQQPPQPQQPTVPQDAYSQAPETGTQAAGQFNPTMFGDQLATFLLFNDNDADDPISSGGAAAAIALIGRGAFKISENESPRPVDRVYLDYNHFDRIFRSVDLNREVLGVEKTLLDGNASIGLRLPFVQLGGDPVTGDPGRSATGDLTVVTKYALINNRETGNVLSTGLVVTFPTGPDFFAVPGLHSTLLQPWVGGICNMNRLYLHGFLSVVIPTDSIDTVILFNDWGVGYFLYRAEGGEGCLSAVVPTFEVHFNDPLNHRGSSSTPIGVDDVIDLTYGVTFGLGQHSTLGVSLVTPVTGPRPFDWEAQVNFNCRF